MTRLAWRFQYYMDLMREVLSVHDRLFILWDMESH